MLTTLRRKNQLHVEKKLCSIIKIENSRVAKEEEGDIQRVPGRIADDFYVIWNQKM